MPYPPWAYPRIKIQQEGFADVEQWGIANGERAKISEKLFVPIALCAVSSVYNRSVAPNREQTV